MIFCHCEDRQAAMEEMDVMGEMAWTDLLALMERIVLAVTRIINGGGGASASASTVSANQSNILTDIQNSIQQLRNQQSSILQHADSVVESTAVHGGSTYVRWGRTTCGNNSHIIHEGFVGGQHYTHAGGASNYQCLPLDPEFNQWNAGDHGNWMYGAEFETGSHGIFPASAQNQNVPCARCYTPTRSANMMIPAKLTCPTSWTKEYDGYLMSGHHSHKRAYSYECVDKEPEYIVGSSSDLNGALFYFNQISCASTGHCPPYIQSAEVACVVCTK